MADPETSESRRSEPPIAADGFLDQRQVDERVPSGPRPRRSRGRVM